MDFPPPTVPADAPPAFVAQMEEVRKLDQQCLDRVVQKYQVHPMVLSVIAHAEGGWAGAKIKNTDGTFDLGLMQINTIHLPELANYGITEKMLVNNECINLGVAAWYVRRVTVNQDLSDRSAFFRSIARYHNKQEPHISVYAKRLEEAFDKIIEQYGGQS
jgi:hypothetical protein